MIVVVDDMITIGDFSRRYGLSPKVLRTYAEAGVLVPAAVDPASGYRYYELAQLEQAATVRRLRRAGVGLADISPSRSVAATTASTTSSSVSRPTGS